MTTATKPRRLLTQNSELRPLGIWNWTLPAWVAKKSDGTAINVCPAAGACVKYCYAMNGTYNFPNVKAAHQRNLDLVTDDLGGFTAAMVNELDAKRFSAKGRPTLPDMPRDHLSPRVAQMLDEGNVCVRIHDAGDFFSDEYLLAWLTIAQMVPHVLFFCYTKEVSRFRRVVEGAAPENFLWVYSLGGKEDHLLDLEVDRHADVFPSEEAVEEAGYYSQEDHDLLCVVSPNHKVGIPANNIPHFNKKLDGRTFGEVEPEMPRHGKAQG